MHSISALSKKVEDDECRELVVSRKETLFESLIMFKNKKLPHALHHGSGKM